MPGSQARERRWNLQLPSQTRLSDVQLSFVFQTAGSPCSVFSSTTSNWETGAGESKVAHGISSPFPARPCLSLALVSPLLVVEEKKTGTAYSLVPFFRFWSYRQLRHCPVSVLFPGSTERLESPMRKESNDDLGGGGRGRGRGERGEGRGERGEGGGGRGEGEGEDHPVSQCCMKACREDCRRHEFLGFHGKELTDDIGLVIESGDSLDRVDHGRNLASEIRKEKKTWRGSQGIFGICKISTQRHTNMPSVY